MHIGHVDTRLIMATAVLRKVIAVVGLVAFTVLCAAGLVALAVVAATVGALILEAVIG